MVLEVVEVQAALFQFVDGDFCLSFRLDVPVEVELPRRDRRWQVALSVTQCDAQLDDF